ncbi:hypothetical protein AB0G67_45850 [Streptomyces sp. NPDC021056]
MSPELKATLRVDAQDGHDLRAELNHWYDKLDTSKSDEVRCRM